MANADKEEDPPLTLLRITVLGSSCCGKTSFISAFVNNHVPTMYTRTDDPAVFYKALSVKFSDNGKFMPILCEVEDTYASDRTDGQDMYGHDRNGAEFFLNLHSHHHLLPEQKRSMFSLKFSLDASEAIPFGNVEPPSDELYAPVAHHRMGFILLVDLQNEESLKNAISVYSAMERAWSQRHSGMPVIYLVVTKSDKSSKTADAQRVHRRAFRFAESKGIKYKMLSCFDFQKVRMVFREVLVDIHKNETLWKPGMTPRSEISVDKTPREPEQKCMQQ